MRVDYSRRSFYFLLRGQSAKLDQENLNSLVIQILQFVNNEVGWWRWKGPIDISFRYELPLDSSYACCPVLVLYELRYVEEFIDESVLKKLVLWNRE